MLLNVCVSFFNLEIIVASPLCFAASLINSSIRSRLASMSNCIAASFVCKFWYSFCKSSKSTSTVFFSTSIFSEIVMVFATLLFSLTKSQMVITLVVVRPIIIQKSKPRFLEDFSFS